MIKFVNPASESEPLTFLSKSKISKTATKSVYFFDLYLFENFVLYQIVNIIDRLNSKKI